MRLITKRTSQRGVTLVELVIVLALLIVITTLIISLTTALNGLVKVNDEIDTRRGRKVILRKILIP